MKSANHIRVRSLLAVTGFIAAAIPGAAHAQSTASPFTEGTRYDAAGRVTGTILPDPDGAGPLKFAAVRNTYDSAGRLTKVEKGELSSWQATTVAPASWGAAFAVQQSVETAYDNVGQKVRDTVKAANGTIHALTQYSYSNGRLDCTAVRMNSAAFASPPASACTLGTEGSQGPDRITRNVYDAAGQLKQLREGVGTSIEAAEATYAYTGNGKRSTVIDANGNRATLTYDGFDRQARWIFPSATRPSAFDDSNVTTALATAGSSNSADYEEYAYDPNGNRTSLRKRDGSTLTYSYDALDRMTVKVVPSRAGLTAAQTRDVFYGYDLRGLQLTAKFDSASGADGVTNAYNGFGELVSSAFVLGSFNKTLTYLHDENGNRTRVTHPDAQAFTYAYDGTDRLSGVYQGTGTTTPLATFAWNADGTLGSRSEGAGSSAAYSYDGVGRLSGQSDAFAGGTGNVAWTFAHNPASQIVTLTRDNDAYAFAPTSANKNYTANGLNQYTAAGGAALTYDANGNLTNDGSSSYVYDVENRLVAATAAGQTTVLTYDPLGRLVRVVKGATDNRFLHDGDALVAEFNASNSLTNRHVHGSNAAADDPLVWYVGSGTASKRWLHADHLGSIVAATSSSGGSPSINTYDEYGVPGASNVGRFQYTGQVYIPELALHYYKARFYDAKLGRFLQVDPIGYDGGINLYAYVEIDPVNSKDPTGTCAYCHQTQANFLSGIVSHVRDVPYSLKTIADSTGINGTQAQNRARLIDQLTRRGWNAFKSDERVRMELIKTLRENKAYVTGRAATGPFISWLTRIPVAGMISGTLSLHGGVARVIGGFVAQLEQGGVDPSKISDRTLGTVAAFGFSGGSVRFDSKSGDVTGTFKYTPTGSRLQREESVTICNVQDEKGC